LTSAYLTTAEGLRKITAGTAADLNSSLLVSKKKPMLSFDKLTLIKAFKSSSLVTSLKFPMLHAQGGGYCWNKI